jgi:hypothetical protein
MDRPTFDKPMSMAARFADGDSIEHSIEAGDVFFEHEGRRVQGADAKLYVFADGSIYMEAEADGVFDTRAEALDYASKAAQAAHEYQREFGL